MTAKARFGNKWEGRVQIHGVKISLGFYEYRSQAAFAEEIAAKIRKALDRQALISKRQKKEATHNVTIGETGSGKSEFHALIIKEALR